jgi:hypothetical protein
VQSADDLAIVSSIQTIWRTGAICRVVNTSHIIATFEHFECYGEWRRPYHCMLYGDSYGKEQQVAWSTQLVISWIESNPSNFRILW